MTRREFTFSLTFPSGGTQALTIEAWNRADAEALIAAQYPDAALNWII